MSQTSPDARFLRAAQQCRTHDIERLFVFGELVRSVSELIHALQRERGASAIAVGSRGARFQDRVSAQVEQCRVLERDVRARLERIDEKLDGMSFGARFYVRGALAFRALDRLAGLREQIGALSIAPQDAVKAFSDIIGSLLAIGFEVADIATDPEISRALIALANFAQGKEYAGQERATAGGAFSLGRFEVSDQQRLRHLMVAQDQAFRIFSEFAQPSYVEALQQLLQTRDAMEVKRMRKVALGREPASEAPLVYADAWFGHSTARIDAMKNVEAQMTADLSALCTAKLLRSRTSAANSQEEQANEIGATVPVAMLISDANPGFSDLGLTAGVGLYTLDGALPKPMRSIMDVIYAQSRRLNDINHQLESARAALAERKAIERAKGLLMASRRLSEKQAYDLMREAAMNQNKRIYEIAEAIVSMAEILKAPI